MYNSDYIDFNALNFFRGYVRLAGFGLFNSKYSLDNGTIIKVPQSKHVRLVQNQLQLPQRFEIIAHESIIKIISGYIPNESMITMSENEYVNLRARYY